MNIQCQLTHQQVRSLLLEYLKANPQGHWEVACSGVYSLARVKKLVSATPVSNCTVSGMSGDEYAFKEPVREILWTFLVQGIIVFGKDPANASWPWFRLTQYGRTVADGQRPQPYDPDGFLAEFKRAVPAADPVVYEYLEEAVHSFNHGCPKAAAVMLGAASEKAILLLHETFSNAIADQSRKERFDKDSNANRGAISTISRVLLNRLDAMVEAKKLKGLHADTVMNLLPSGFELIRRLRNSAGHPAAPGSVEPDTVFLNLRLFTEYARSVFALVEHFSNNPADW